MNYFYSPVELADELWYERESTRFSTTELNRKYIPEMLKIDKNRKFQSSKFLFSKVAREPSIFAHTAAKQKRYLFLYLLNSKQLAILWETIESRKLTLSKW